MRPKPTRTLGALATAATAAAASSGFRTVSFQSQPGVNYALSADAVAGQFCDPNSPLSLSGYFGVDGSRFNDLNNSKHYFYWFFERRSTSLLPEDERPPPRLQDDENIPFVVWLNGGPGCSSLLGALQENGPCLVNDDGNSTRLNPYSWTEAAHVLFLDQPALTGYSYGGTSNIDDNEEMVAEDAYYFLQSFFQSAEGEKYMDLPLFLTGESYAGHYLPGIAQRIQAGNRNLQDGDGLLSLPLAGVAIGNGMMDELEQMPWYPEMAFNNPHGLKIINETEYEHMKTRGESCARDVRMCREGGRSGSELDRSLICQKASWCSEETFFGPFQMKNVSVYDITKPCIGPLCDDMTSIETFLNLPETKKSLHVPPSVTWEACDNYVNQHWTAADREATFAPVISELLDENVPVLIYSGDLDYICNYMGCRAVALGLEWGGGDAFRAAEDHDWNDGGGLARSAGNLLGFLQVYNAGHMVPRDQPEQALVMITQFLNGGAF